jgi:predicted N-acetyltransferase YhbS
VEIHEACEVFLNGFSFTRSFTHPYLVRRVPPLMLMVDAPRRSGEYRRTEVVTCCTDPTQVCESIAGERIGHHCLCVITPSSGLDPNVRDRFKRSGYRLGGTQGFFVRDLSDVSEIDGETLFAEIRRVTTTEQLVRANTAAGSRLLRPEHVEANSSIRLYFAELGGEIVGHVRSVAATPKGCWVAGLYVWPDYRRRGIAKALMNRMLVEDREAGASHSVLLASHAGALLYPVLGYRRIGTLHLFTPINRNEAGDGSPNKKES